MHSSTRATIIFILHHKFQMKLICHNKQHHTINMKDSIKLKICFVASARNKDPKWSENSSYEIEFVNAHLL